METEITGMYNQPDIRKQKPVHTFQEDMYVYQKVVTFNHILYEYFSEVIGLLLQNGYTIMHQI